MSVLILSTSLLGSIVHSVVGQTADTGASSLSPGSATYRIRSDYCTYPYKRRVKKFRSLQIIASVLFLYFFMKAYVVSTHLNCIDLSMQFK